MTKHSPDILLGIASCRAEISQLDSMISDLPPSSVIDLMSLTARRESVKEELKELEKKDLEMSKTVETDDIKDLVFIGRIWNDSHNAPSINIASYREAIECCASCIWKAIEDGKEPVGIFLSSVSDHDICPLCKTEYSDLSQKKATEWVEKNILSYSEAEEYTIT